MQSIKIIIYQEIAVFTHDIPLNSSSFKHKVIGHFKNEYREDITFQLHILRAYDIYYDHMIKLMITCEDYTLYEGEIFAAMIRVICKETGHEHTEIYNMLRKVVRSYTTSRSVAKNIWNMLSLSECRHMDKLTFLCFIDVLKYKKDTIAAKFFCQREYDPIECIWNINQNRLKQFLKNKKDRFMYSDMFRNYDEEQKMEGDFFLFLRLMRHRNSGGFHIHFRIHAPCYRWRIAFKYALWFDFGDEGNEWRCNGYTAGNKVNYKLYPSGFQGVLERNIARLRSIKIRIDLECTDRVFRGFKS